MFGNIVSIIYLVSLFVFVLIPYVIVIGETLIYKSASKKINIRNAFGDAKVVPSIGGVFKPTKSKKAATFMKCIRDVVGSHLPKLSDGLKQYPLAAPSWGMTIFIVIACVLFVTAFGILVNMVVEYNKEEEEDIFSFLEDVGNCVSLGIMFFIFFIGMMIFYERYYKREFKNYLINTSRQLTTNALDEIAKNSSEKYGYSKNNIDFLREEGYKETLMKNCNGRIKTAIKDLLIKQNPQIGNSVMRNIYEQLKESPSIYKKRQTMKFLYNFSAFPVFALSILVYIILI